MTFSVLTLFHLEGILAIDSKEEGEQRRFTVSLLYDYDLTSFNRCAWRCRLNAEAALQEIQGAIYEANNEVIQLADTDKYGTDSWGAIAGNDWMRWWHQFLRQYESKCERQWRENFGGKDEEIATSKSWIEAFIPLYIEGCFIVKHIRVREIKQIVVGISNAPELPEEQRQTWLQWGNALEQKVDEMLTGPLTTQIELYDQVAELDLGEGAKKDISSPMTKLKQIMLAKRDWKGKIQEPR